MQEIVLEDSNELKKEIGVRLKNCRENVLKIYAGRFCKIIGNIGSPDKKV